MRPTRPDARSGRALLLTVVLSLTEQPGALAVDPKPPVRMAQGEKGKGVVWFGESSPGTTGRIGYSLENRTVSVAWGWSSDGPRPAQFSIQEESVTFWPTEAVGAGEQHVAVAGRRRNGNTVIEIWKFGAPPALTGKLDASGDWIYPEMHVPVNARWAIFDEKSTGRDMINVMFWNPVHSEGYDISLYVLFDDSRDLCRINGRTDGTATIERVASMAAGTGVPVVTALSCQHGARWSGNHMQSGYVYILANPSNSGSICQRILFLDRNRDGMIDADGILSPDMDGWNAMGLSDATRFHRFH